MNKITFTLVTLALCGGVAFSQSMTDAFKYGQQDLTGTARYMGMAGAFGALGGDISAMKTNPAGLGVYRSSEVVATLSLNMVNSETNWFGIKEKGDRTNVTFDNMAYVGYFPTGNETGIVGWNAGFAYNRLKNFSRNYQMSSGSSLHTSLSDYTAARAYGIDASQLLKTNSFDPYYPSGSDWMSVLSYNAGFMDDYNTNHSDYYSVFGYEDQNEDWIEYDINNAILNVQESGSIDQYDISFAMNISDRVFLGATVAVTDINYNYQSSYDELFEYENNDFYLDNGLSTDGTGYSFNVGAIVRPTDFLRLGVAYNSPTWYKMTDYYFGEARSTVTYPDYKNGGAIVQVKNSDNTPGEAYTDYEYRSPDKWILSAAAIIGQSALLSVDYEMTNYGQMKMYDRYGVAWDGVNEAIKLGYKMGNTLRIGGEVKITPQFALRAGYAWSSTPLTVAMDNGDREVVPSGTIPNYTLNTGSMNYTVGLGYRFTPNFYADIACVLTDYKEDVFAFSNIFDEQGAYVIEAQPATMSTKTTRIGLTLGYKF